MSRGSHLTQDDFNRFLMALDPERDRAGAKYEQMRISLIKFFAWRGVVDPEELADEAISRLVQKIETLDVNYDINRYVYVIAAKIFREYRRHVAVESRFVFDETRLVENEVDNALEKKHECLDRCLKELPPESRDLILRYYEKERGAKIDHRKLLAQQFGLTTNSLRVKVHRIRSQLNLCIESCLKSAPHELD